MDETIAVPSPNWFQSSGLAVSPDGWVVYGGPSKSLCVLEPLPKDYQAIAVGNQAYTAHVLNRVHPERITCVDICPEWPQKRAVLTGSADGTVNQWSLEHTDKTLKITSTHNHEIHSNEKEEVIGVGYFENGYAVTVGVYGNIVKWDLNSNVAKNFNQVLKNFKPVCMACSPHIHMQIAIGTKQGVIFVLDLNGTPRIIYKMRGHDDEIVQVSWCPQYEVAVRKCLKEVKKNTLASRLSKIQTQEESEEVLKELDERVKNMTTTEGPVQINENLEPVKITGQQEPLNRSGVIKNLPNDSFDIVAEDDYFDMYKDFEDDEFGPKKYEPEDLVVKVKDEEPKGDFLAECQKLKDEILQRKAQVEMPIEALVEALDKTHVETVPSKTVVEETATKECKNEAVVCSPEPSSDPEPGPTAKAASEEEPAPIAEPAKPKPVEGKITKGEVESSVHIHKHLLATIGKQGSVRVWSKTGKLVASCSVAAGARAQRQRGPPASAALLWHKPDVLLIADSKNQLLDCNPLKFDCKNKLEWRVLHARHKRGLFVIASESPRVQNPAAAKTDYRIWTAGQDRLLITYSMKDNSFVQRETLGGFVYYLSFCPYDPRKMAISVGDGAVRVWDTDTSEEQDNHLTSGNVSNIWNAVQGKVLIHDWHPTKENLLAFATAESRVGLIDVGKPERRAKVFIPILNGPVYSLHWGEGSQLYACGGGVLVIYNADNVEQAPSRFEVEVEGVKWKPTVARWYPQALVVGSDSGGLAVLEPAHPHQVLAADFLQECKPVHTVEWHPASTSLGGGPAELRQALAVCSMQRDCVVTVLQCTDKEGGGKQLTKWKYLKGHKAPVLKVLWSPHHDELLLSTSSDNTIRIWNVMSSSCVSIFGVHSGKALAAAWCPQPALASALLSGGGDCALRLWDMRDHPPHLYQAVTETTEKKKKKPQKRDKKNKEAAEEEAVDAENAALMAASAKGPRKFLLPRTNKQLRSCPVAAPRSLYKILVQRGQGSRDAGQPEFGIEFIKLFLDINELNQVLDTEMERHTDMGAWGAWVIMCIVRGEVDAAVRCAAQRDLLDPFLLAFTPALSFKYWKDSTLLYLQQIDRLIAKGAEARLSISVPYGGAVWRRAAALLALHDVKQAVEHLQESKLFMEAYILSRTRYVESLAKQSLHLWAQDAVIHGEFNLAACCYLALGDNAQAASALGRSNDEEALSLAAEIASSMGQVTFAGHIEQKKELIKKEQTMKEAKKEKEEILDELPSRVELLALKEAEAKKESDELSDGISTTDEDDVNKIPIDTKLVSKKDIGVNTISSKADQFSSPKVLEQVETENINLKDSKYRKETKKEALTLDDIKAELDDTKDIRDKLSQIVEFLEELPKRMHSLVPDSKECQEHRGDGDSIHANNEAVATPQEANETP